MAPTVATTTPTGRGCTTSCAHATTWCSDGDCDVLNLPEALEPLVDYDRRISGEHPDWDDYQRAMRDGGKSLLRITPTRLAWTATGGFPARLAGR